MNYRNSIAREEIAVLPSLLAADFGCLGSEAKRAEAAGADALHLDIMDGHFVPNLSMGPDVVAMARRHVRIPLSVHLMLSEPGKYLEKFVRAGADILLIHVEVEGDLGAMLREIRRLGARPGLTLNPGTAADLLWPYLEDIDEVLCMTVNPGYGGQKFMTSVVPKIQVIRDHFRAHGMEKDISVDGGIDAETVKVAAAAGCNVLIAGTSLYGADSMPDAISRMRTVAQEAFRQSRK